VIVEFSRKKLPKEAGANMRASPISGVQPFVAMPAPVYVFLRANEKFVAVKGPLDFFTPEELRKLLPMESFFLPDFIDHVATFRNAGKKARALLLLEQELAPYEVSDAVIRIVGSLWNPAGIESLFVSAFLVELCDPLPGPVLEEARNRDVEDYEKRLLLSSWIAFLALHLGYCDLAFLNELRSSVFRREVGERIPAELAELTHIVRRELEARSYRQLEPDAFSGMPQPVARKAAARFARIERKIMKAGAAAPSIYGPQGFIDE
jgi:hypothetical protein